MTNEAAPSNTPYRCDTCGKYFLNNVYHVCYSGKSYDGMLEAIESDTDKKLDRIIELLEQITSKPVESHRCPCVLVHKKAERPTPTDFEDGPSLEKQKDLISEYWNKHVNG